MEIDTDGKEPFRILVDWGGTIIRDSNLYESIAYESGNTSARFRSPEDWDGIRSVSQINKFKDIQSDFFKLGTPYPGALETITDFSGRKDTQAFIVFDGKPKIEMTDSAIIFQMSSYLTSRGFFSSGYYVWPDKINCCKKVGIDLAVEDDPRVAVALAFAGIKTLLLLRRWNMGFDFSALSLMTPPEKTKKIMSNLYVCEDWPEAASCIEHFVSSAK